MRIDLSGVFETPGKVLEESFPPETLFSELKWFRMGGSSYKLREAQPFVLRAEGTEKGKARLAGEARMTFEARCDRCLAPVMVPLEISFARTVSSQEAEPPEEETDAEESRECISGDELDVKALLESEIALAFPLKILCREACKGLCPVCGANRNERDCGCDTFVPDPRFAGLSGLNLPES